MYLTENWRLKEQRYTLTGNYSANEEVNFPPRPVQPRTVETFDFTSGENQPLELSVEDNYVREVA